MFSADKAFQRGAVSQTAFEFSISVFLVQFSALKNNVVAEVVKKDNVFSLGPGSVSVNALV